MISTIRLGHKRLKDHYLWVRVGLGTWISKKGLVKLYTILLNSSKLNNKCNNNAHLVVHGTGVTPGFG